MSRLSTDEGAALGAATDETAWEGFTDDTAILQRDCPDCDKGLLSAPARFCPVCAGSGYLSRTVPRLAPAPLPDGEAPRCGHVSHDNEAYGRFGYRLEPCGHWSLREPCPAPVDAPEETP